MAIRVDTKPALIKACVKKTKRYVQGGSEIVGFQLELSLIPHGATPWEVAFAHVDNPEQWEQHSTAASTVTRFSPKWPGVVELPGHEVFVFISRRILTLL